MKIKQNTVQSGRPYILDHPYRTIIVGGSGSGKTNTLLNLINNQPDIDNDPKAFIEYSNDMQDVYKNIEDYNPGKKRKVLIVLDDMIADMNNNNKKLNSIVTELFIGGMKIIIYIVFIMQSYFKVPKEIRLNTTPFFYNENS